MKLGRNLDVRSGLMIFLLNELREIFLPNAFRIEMMLLRELNRTHVVLIIQSYRFLVEKAGSKCCLLSKKLFKI